MRQVQNAPEPYLLREFRDGATELENLKERRNVQEELNAPPQVELTTSNQREQPLKKWSSVMKPKYLRKLNLGT